MDEVIQWILKTFQLFYRLHHSTSHTIFFRSPKLAVVCDHFFVNLTDLNSLNLIQTDDIIKFEVPSRPKTASHHRCNTYFCMGCNSKSRHFKWPAVMPIMWSSKVWHGCSAYSTLLRLKSHINKTPPIGKMLILSLSTRRGLSIIVLPEHFPSPSYLSCILKIKCEVLPVTSLVSSKINGISYNHHSMYGQLSPSQVEVTSDVGFSVSCGWT